MKPADCPIFQTHYDERSAARLDPAFQPLDIRHNLGGKYYEFGVMREMLEPGRVGAPAWGIVSWKFELKTAVEAGTFAAFARQHIDEADVVFINPFIMWHALALNVWEQGEAAHPGIVQLAGGLTGVGSLAGVLMKHDSFAYCNYFVARRAFWERFVAFVVERFVAPLESRAEGDPLAAQAHAHAGHRGSNASYIPFVIERLFSTFLSLYPEIRRIAYRPPIDVYRRKFGDEAGAILFGIAAAKERIAAPNDPAHRAWMELRQTFLRCYGNLAALDDPQA